MTPGFFLGGGGGSAMTPVLGCECKDTCCLRVGV